MKKIGFVTAWYGDKIPGGAEMELRGLVKHLMAAGQEVEVLTTCVKEFTANWNINYHKPGPAMDGGVPVRRFKVRRRNPAAFNRVNTHLMNGEKITPAQEEIFIRDMINSPALIEYLRKNQDEYSCFVCIPYMFGPVYHTALACPEKTILIPCFHEEAYFHMEIFKNAFSKVRGIVYNAQPEKELANREYNLAGVSQLVLGVGVDTDLTCDAARFRQKFGIESPFVLYAGRKDAGKNIDTLIRYFAAYKADHPDDLKLVLIGGGRVNLPAALKDDVVDLGFVEIQDKYDAYAAAELLCQPSLHESFSLVVMESWLCGRPVLVHEGCEVTKNFVQTANAGLYFGSYPDFAGCLDYYLAHPDTAARMGALGRRYVLDHFAHEVIVKRFTEFLKATMEENASPSV